MKVLMFGWEFPPYSSGGLGTACYGLTKGLSNEGVDVVFVVPKSASKSSHVKLLSAGLDKISFKEINSALAPYMTSSQYEINLNNNAKFSIYGKNLFEEVYRYSEIAKKIASEENFDVIHSHDWMSFRAGINAKLVSGKPLVVHVHATEFDRTGDHGVNQEVYTLEREGMQFADSIIAVSNFTKSKIVEHYGIQPDKVKVVHNAVDFKEEQKVEPDFGFERDEKNSKTVLYLGRVTIQKGPDHFLHAAKKVLEHEPDARFIVAGTGDMERQTIELAVNLGIASKVIFAGFIDQEKINRIYKMANLYVMPSVSEPFGITPLESLKNGTPVIISKQSGVSEVLNHCLKVDFWDINEMANKIVSVLKYNALHEELKKNGRKEVKKLSWRRQARKCVDVYRQLYR